ncbi:MAG TPA: hypothetical protein VIJ83_06095 [Solirubrobacteraceae bacterium]
MRKLVTVLETIAVPVADARGSATQRDQLTRLIFDGRELERLFRDMAHGEPVAPPPISGISGWFRDAKRVAQAVQVLRAEPVADAQHSDQTPSRSGSLDQLTNNLWATTLELLERTPDGSMTGEGIRLSAVTMACAVAFPPSPDHDAALDALMIGYRIRHAETLLCNAKHLDNTVLDSFRAVDTTLGVGAGAPYGAMDMTALSVAENLPATFSGPAPAWFELRTLAAVHALTRARLRHELAHRVGDDTGEAPTVSAQQIAIAVDRGYGLRFAEQEFERREQ